MPEVFIYVQQEVLVMAHTTPCLAKRKCKARWWSMTIQARDDKDLCMFLMARPTWSEVPSTTLVRFFYSYMIGDHPIADSSKGCNQYC
jgi:hypothetical protein